MRRKYNYNISDRANRSLAKREAQVRKQKRFLFVFLLLAIVMGILIGIKVPVLAGKDHDETVQKYYKTICVEAGDTLWDIAGMYMAESKMTRQEYIDAICALNNINEDEICAGEHIIVMYYVSSDDNAR